jgi:hypothetical protein
MREGVGRNSVIFSTEWTHEVGPRTVGISANAPLSLSIGTPRGPLSQESHPFGLPICLGA